MILTHKQIKAAAKRSRKSAIKCSLRHWQEMRAATKRELARGVAKGSSSTLYSGIGSCALCEKYFRKGGCAVCGLWNGEQCAENRVFCGAENTLMDYRNGYATRKEWQAAADVVIARLKELK